MRFRCIALMLSIAAWPILASAQTAPPASRPARPAAAEPKRPAAAEPKQNTPAAPGRDLNAGLPLGDRLAIQLDLAWTGFYNGLITGELNDRTIAAVKAFQRDFKFKETGTLAAAERTLLGNLSKEKQDQVGWRMVEDKATGAQVGLPSKQVPNTAPGKSGTRWFSAQGQIQVETFRVSGPGTSLADVFDEQKKQPAGRRIEVNLLRPDFFILSGTQGLKKFYVRAEIRNGEVRGVTILYDQATEGIMDPVTVVMSSAFAPFAGTGLAALARTPVRRKVEYGSGIIVTAAGHILTDRHLTEGCSIISVAGIGDAERVAEDTAGDLALLRVYGAGELSPAALVHEGARGPDLTLIGIADPQLQGGGNAVSTLASRLDGAQLLPPPPAGFYGAAAIDGQGRLFGMIALKESAAAGAGLAAPASQATAVPVQRLRSFLDSQSVPPASGRAGLDAAKAALVRVICVRN
jgi:peptidoglycan hydrolase-like protein with peptidoglycan-binding domain